MPRRKQRHDDVEKPAKSSSKSQATTNTTAAHGDVTKGAGRSSWPSGLMNDPGQNACYLNSGLNALLGNSMLGRTLADTYDPDEHGSSFSFTHQYVASSLFLIPCFRS